MGFYDSVNFHLSFTELVISRFLPAGFKTILGNVATSTLGDVLIQKTPTDLHMSATPNYRVTLRNCNTVTKYSHLQQNGTADLGKPVRKL